MWNAEANPHHASASSIRGGRIDRSRRARLAVAAGRQRRSTPWWRYPYLPAGAIERSGRSHLVSRTCCNLFGRSPRCFSCLCAPSYGAAALLVLATSRPALRIAGLPRLLSIDRPRPCDQPSSIGDRVQGRLRYLAALRRTARPPPSTPSNRRWPATMALTGKSGSARGPRAMAVSRALPDGA